MSEGVGANATSSETTGGSATAAAAAAAAVATPGDGATAAAVAAPTTDQTSTPANRLSAGGLTPLLQPLDRMLNKQMKRSMRAKYTAYTATAAADPSTGKLKPPGRGAVSTWCKESWTAITPDTVKTCFKVCGLTLALDGSEDHAWCEHNFGEGYRELLQQQRATWEEEHPGVTLPPLELPVVPESSAAGTIPVMAAEKELEGKLLPPSDEGGSDSDIELVEVDSDVARKPTQEVGVLECGNEKTRPRANSPIPTPKCN